MELRERIALANATREEAPRDLFTEVKDRIHAALIADLGPQLFNADVDERALRSRVKVEIHDRLSQERGLSHADKERLVEEMVDDVLGHGPLERLLRDESVSEIMVNGPHDVWIERRGKLYETTVRFADEQHLRRIINKIVSQIGRRVDEA
jgi:pilus assembly protein CpaF